MLHDSHGVAPMQVPALLLAGTGRTAALRQAMRTLRKTKPHPHFWAPFITIGRDSPLRGIEPVPTSPQAPSSGVADHVDNRR